MNAFLKVNKRDTVCRLTWRCEALNQDLNKSVLALHDGSLLPYRKGLCSAVNVCQATESSSPVEDPPSNEQKAWASPGFRNRRPRLDDDIQHDDMQQDAFHAAST